MSKFKEVRFFSAILSATVISLNAIASSSIENNLSEKGAWLVCTETKGNNINCDNTEDYRLISDPVIIKKLEAELSQKQEYQLTVRIVELSHEEINKYFAFLSSDKPIYQEPKVRFNILNDLEELELKEQLKAIKHEIINNKVIDPDTLYNNPKLKLNTIPKKSFDEILNKFRRNNYGLDREKGGAYVVCGVVGTVAAVKAMDIVGSKVGNKTNSGGRNIVGNDSNSNDEKLLEKIIPIIPKGDKCNDR